MSDWLDLELAHHLAPTGAPDQLWERLQQGRPAPRPRTKWPVAAVIATLTVAAGTLWMVAHGQERAADLRLLASRELASHPTLDLHSHDPREIAAWARREAGVDLALSPAASVELTGARVVRHRGECVAAVSYKVDGRDAALLVARAAVAPGEAHAGMSLAVAFDDAAHADAACRICHSNL